MNHKMSSSKCYKMSNACVLTQIPLPGTRSNFWQMLWENDLREVFLLDDDKVSKITVDRY